MCSYNTKHLFQHFIEFKFSNCEFRVEDPEPYFKKRSDHVVFSNTYTRNESRVVDPGKFSPDPDPTT